MKYIVFTKKRYNMFAGECIERTELKNDKELKEYLFNNKDNLSNIEIFNKDDRVEIKIDINVSKKGV